MARQQGPDPINALMGLIAWVIGWVGDHDWSALMRLVVLVLTCATALGILISAAYLAGWR